MSLRPRRFLVGRRLDSLAEEAMELMDDSSEVQVLQESPDEKELDDEKDADSGDEKDGEAVGSIPGVVFHGVLVEIVA